MLVERSPRQLRRPFPLADHLLRIGQQRVKSAASLRAKLASCVAEMKPAALVTAVARERINLHSSIFVTVASLLQSELYVIQPFEILQRLSGMAQRLLALTGAQLDRIVSLDGIVG